MSEKIVDVKHSGVKEHPESIAEVLAILYGHLRQTGDGAITPHTEPLPRLLGPVLVPELVPVLDDSFGTL